jgi:ATP-binding cassette subfamily B multidrug efflux pump
MAEFMMWHMSALFENVGTIQDGMQTLGKKINKVEVINHIFIVISKAYIFKYNLTFGHCKWFCIWSCILEQAKK